MTYPASQAGKRWYIYALRDPLSWEVRYVGKANDPEARLRRHLADASKTKHYAGRWLRRLSLRGLRPFIELLDAGRGDGHRAAERAWIAELGARGASLTNTAPGGQGGCGPCSPEHRAKLSASNIGKKRSPETCARVGMAHRGIRQSAETRAKRSASLRGRSFTPERCANISAGLRGKPKRAETKAKIAATLRGRKPDDATRAKLSVSQRARRERERAERQMKKSES